VTVSVRARGHATSSYTVSVLALLETVTVAQGQLPVHPFHRRLAPSRPTLSSRPPAALSTLKALALRLPASIAVSSQTVSRSGRLATGRNRRLSVTAFLFSQAGGRLTRRCARPSLAFSFSVFCFSRPLRLPPPARGRRPRPPGSRSYTLLSESFRRFPSRLRDIPTAICVYIYLTGCY
jgi:hypothetical protein